MPLPSPDRIVVLHSPDAPGYFDVREGTGSGAQVATAFRSGGPGAATVGAGELTIGAPAPSPAGSHRLLIGPDGVARGYLEYRSHSSMARCVIAIVDDERGVLAWTRERSAPQALLWRMGLMRSLPSTAVLMGQEERGSLDAIEGGHALTWHGRERLPRRESLLLAVAPVLGARA